MDLLVLQDLECVMYRQLLCASHCAALKAGGVAK